MGKIDVKQESTTPANPPSTYSRIYPKTDGNWYGLTPAGVETQLGPISYGTPVNTGTANSDGVAVSAARSDHIHNTVVANSIAATVTTTSTSSTSYVDLDSMTLTPAAGTYLVMHNNTHTNSGNGADRQYFIINSAGSDVASSERHTGTSGGSYGALQTSAIVTVNGSQAIKVRYRATGGTVSVDGRSLTIIRLG